MGFTTTWIPPDAQQERDGNHWIQAQQRNPVEYRAPEQRRESFAPDRGCFLASCCFHVVFFKTISFPSNRNTLLLCLCLYAFLSLTQLHFFRKNDVENNPYRGSCFSFVVKFGRSESSKLYPSWMSLDVYMVLCATQCFSLCWHGQFQDCISFCSNRKTLVLCL